MKIYFAGSIRGGRSDVAIYAQIIDLLKAYGTVLDEHIADPNLSQFGEIDLSDAQVKQRDQAWINEADYVVAELSSPSHGVGYEVGLAMHLGKPVLGLWREQKGKRPSPMLAGSATMHLSTYTDIAELPEVFHRFFVPSFNTSPPLADNGRPKH
jgi:nucleoside 2-deoxyribosyltransferase